MSLRPPWDSVAGPLGTQARIRTAGASGEEWFIFVVLCFVRSPSSLSLSELNKPDQAQKNEITTQPQANISHNKRISNNCIRHIRRKLTGGSRDLMIRITSAAESLKPTL